MISPFLRLSVDETAAALAQAGFAEPARALLQRYLEAPLTDEAARERLIAASHGLLARQLIRPQGEAAVADTELLEAMTALGTASTVLRLSLLFADGEIGEVIVPSGARFLHHVTLYELVHEFRWIDTQSAVIDWMANFFDIDAPRPFEAETVVLPEDATQPILAGRSPDEVSARLRAAGAPEPTIALLLDDLHDGVTIGTVTLVTESGEDRSRELLLLRSQERLWLVARTGSGEARLMPGTPKELRRHFGAVAGGLA